MNRTDPFGLWEYAEKYGTSGEFLSENNRKIEDAVDQIYNNLLGHNATVTYTVNGVHGQRSWHYNGNAVDTRVWGMSDSMRRTATRNIQDALGNNYQVIDENDHIHIEYDPPGGPPAPSRSNSRRNSRNCGCQN